jgi:flagellar hook-associated protein 1 FlgK
MSISSALHIANSGLANVNAQLAVLSQNIANASTPGYATEVGSQINIAAQGVGIGVMTGPVTLAVQQGLQQSIVQQNATVANLTTAQSALQAIDPVLGSVGQGTDLGSLLANLSNSFSALMTTPSNQTQQTAVVGQATTLAAGINRLADAYTAQRQAAQNDLQAAVATLNDKLTTIGKLSTQIIAQKAMGQSTADLENQRNQAVNTLSPLVNLRTQQQANGDLSVFTPGGLVLPTTNTVPSFAIAPAVTAPGAYYPGGGLPGITLNGQDVTANLTGGQIGAGITLRDQTLPTAQAELDEFAAGLANRFAAQGLTLFTDASGGVPAGGGTPAQAGYVGLSSVIRVNSAVSANPALVRDGTAAVTGSPTGPSDFTPNPSGGPVGFTALIARIVNYALTGNAQDGVPQPPLNTTGLGATGTLNAPFGTTGSLADYATSLVASQSQQSATTTADLATETAVQATFTSRFAASSGVNMDTELSRMLVLQNAYSANARVLNTLQAMFTQLLNAVQ